ncbi:hypothetical protein GCM10007876_18170 [Litoribrevibacter albus]|uniref:Uncharacterized protein n=2 Tax=Litoribrevibacter albus TaxID=1473156 RepID=A0AA37SB47_9GAMM|nr:hypothetical protein GCM10007876_18170 [Litoribrevibacter albus]
MLLPFVLVISGCFYAYHPPNYRAPETPGRKVAETSFGGMETYGEATKYDLMFMFHYDFKQGKRPKYPTGRDFRLTKQYSKFADSPEFKQDPSQFIYGYRKVSGYEYNGTWELDRDACILILSNQKTGLSITMTGTVDRLVEHAYIKGQYVTHMAYTVMDSTLPELTGQRFVGDDREFVCKK